MLFGYWRRKADATTLTMTLILTNAGLETQNRECVRPLVGLPNRVEGSFRPRYGLPNDAS